MRSWYFTACLLLGLLSLAGCAEYANPPRAEDQSPTNGQVLHSRADERGEHSTDQDEASAKEELAPATDREEEVALPSLAEACEQAYDRDQSVCADDLACAYGVCEEATLDLGEGCDINEDLCLPGTLCVSLGEMNTAGTCQPRREVGEACAYGRDCAHGLRCERPTPEPGVCKPRFKLGETCAKSGFGYDCEHGLTCFEGQCIAGHKR